MVCPKCGHRNSDDAIFCNACGNRLDINNNPGNNGVQNLNGIYGTNIKENMNINKNYNSYNENNGYNTNYGINNNLNLQPLNNTIDIPIEKKKERKKGSLIPYIISIILGIFTLISSFLLNIIVLPFEIIGLLLGVISRKGNGIAGITINLLAMVVSIVVFSLGTILQETTTESTTDNSNSNKLKYISKYECGNYRSTNSSIEYNIALELKEDSTFQMYNSTDKRLLSINGIYSMEHTNKDLNGITHQLEDISNLTYDTYILSLSASNRILNGKEYKETYSEQYAFYLFYNYDTIELESTKSSTKLVCRYEE